MVNNKEVEISDLAYGGMGIAKLDGKVYFIEGALPGEKVRFVKKIEKKRFGTGKVTEVLVASDYRMESPCPYYSECGGCQYQHLDYKKEVFYKTAQVKEMLRRIGGLGEYIFAGMRPSSLDYGYRWTITLHKANAGYGYFAQDNKTIINIEHCNLAADAINSAISTLPASGAKRDITLKSDKANNVWISGHSGHRFFKDDFLGTELMFSPLAFSQANRQVAAEMVDELRTLMQKEKTDVLFDLYCGVGFFGILMRDLFESVIGIDEKGVAIDCAKASKKNLGLDNIKFYCGEADKDFSNHYKHLRGETNTILLDPPRSGISKKITKWLTEITNINSLYYVSCDPAILARDAKALTQDKIWRLDKVSCFDMFPRTKHIESIAVFKRK